MVSNIRRELKGFHSLDFPSEWGGDRVAHFPKIFVEFPFN